MAEASRAFLKSGIVSSGITSKNKNPLSLISMIIFLIFFAYLSLALPTITYVSPTLQNNTPTNKNWVYVNVTSDEDLNRSLLEWGNSSGFTNISMSNQSSSMRNWYVNMTGLTDGAYNYTIWAENTSGNWNQSVRRFVIIDTVPPSIFIPSPANTTYFGKAIDLNVSASEPINTWIYSLNNNPNVTFTPNTTITARGGSNNIRIYANDSAGNINSTITYFMLNTTLEVNLSEPDYSVNTNIIQNTTFLVNATVFCRQGSCGNVAGTIRYNASSQYPDNPVSVAAGAEPLYIQEASPASTKSCAGNPLSEGDSCNLTWTINATDSGFGRWKIGVNFSSDSGWTLSDQTKNATISVVTCSVDVNVTWNAIDFGALLLPNSNNNPASGNAAGLYNITVNQGSCNTDIYIKGDDFQNQTFGYTIGVGNLTWSNTSNNPSSSYNMAKNYVPLRRNVPQKTNVTTWYWMNVPPAFAANYNSTVYIGWVKNGEPSP